MRESVSEDAVRRRPAEDAGRKSGADKAEIQTDVKKVEWGSRHRKRDKDEKKRPNEDEMVITSTRAWLSRENRRPEPGIGNFFLAAKMEASILDEKECCGAGKKTALSQKGEQRARSCCSRSPSTARKQGEKALLGE